jgi:hypothetical protein
VADQDLYFKRGVLFARYDGENREGVFCLGKLLIGKPLCSGSVPTSSQNSLAARFSMLGHGTEEISVPLCNVLDDVFHKPEQIFL